MVIQPSSRLCRLTMALGGVLKWSTPISPRGNARWRYSKSVTAEPQRHARL